MLIVEPELPFDVRRSVAPVVDEPHGRVGVPVKQHVDSVNAVFCKDNNVVLRSQHNVILPLS